MIDSKLHFTFELHEAVVSEVYFPVPMKRLKGRGGQFKIVKYDIFTFLNI